MKRFDRARISIDKTKIKLKQYVIDDFKKFITNSTNMTLLQMENELKTLFSIYGDFIPTVIILGARFILKDTANNSEEAEEKMKKINKDLNFKLQVKAGFFSVSGMVNNSTNNRNLINNNYT